ncbi:helix-turn-helix transcriptional regulator [Ruegeria pomeroyi]|uniref:Helix-turn-helix transcriptional regulator n=1 Tax=Ruegeria pomeroyi TaxID=89184 RepID=A0A9Q3WNZ5_9RHOB|nr:helix-turn-helix transcriptional regulator [Ruegeria pomeroyi]MCE8539305.1 helix-turn-helix transcriptional regulator [Ruegeria pomeroyi]
MWDEAASGFAAMGSVARLKVLRTLVRAGRPGLTVGEIQQRTDMAASTLAHHLKALTAGGVIEQTRQGRQTINCARYDHLEALAQFIIAECCADQCGHDIQETDNG